MKKMKEWVVEVNGVYFRGYGKTIEEAKNDAYVKSLENFLGANTNKKGGR